MTVIDREWLVRKILMTAAMVVVLGLALVVFFVAKEAFPSLRHAGPANLFSSEWDPGEGRYGMLVFLVGTLVTTAGGLLLGTPLALGLALFLTQVAPRRPREIISRAVELLAGIPSIVLGWLGFTVLVPLIRKATGTSGSGILTASVILAVMVVPTITTISRDALEAVPKSYYQASVALGATRWQTVKGIILPAAKNGIMAAIVLGMGRAIGETMAVAMVIGPASVFPTSLTSPTHTMTTKILMEMGESTGIQRSALFSMGLVLLLLAMGLVMLVRRVSRTGHGYSWVE
ncbi:phosphate ABC transporter permease subunit PstC [Candidatus Solincola tengchongensis]|uniref:phosphate ABC transporter permease subunit PstC n=1 Tax=Candidatus Solincola tengchongensis TaxID=2900693 RepID=UPI00258003C8|nr:phosphate ABC transporter permease subunit PstC [Candidatus Solincola tengchongensis]